MSAHAYTGTHTHAQIHTDSIKEGGEDETSQNATFCAASADEGKALPHKDNVSLRQAGRQADQLSERSSEQNKHTNTKH